MGRLAKYIKSDKHLLISPQRITVVFVVSDISTFLVQVRSPCWSRVPLHSH